MQALRNLKTIRGLLLFLLLCWPTLANAEIWVFFRSDIPLHVDTVEFLKSKTDQKLVFCPVGKTSFSFLESHPPQFAVVLGDAALQLALQMVWKVKILVALVDQPPTDPRVMFLNTHQPCVLQIKLLKALKPDLKTIWSPFVTERFAPCRKIESLAEETGVKIDIFRLSNPRELPGAMRVLSQPNTAVMIPPDPGIMNNAIIQSIFLASFRSQTPVVSFSESLVKQGAVFAHVLTPLNLATSLGEIINEALNKGQSLPSARSFERWELILNTTVLEKFKLQVPDEIKKSATRLY
ncbi:MAG: hypothetical protein ACD_39C00218G0002 [uncultured bacterium]|nr:MAG: hypothetical protein ACD_39C00218G0002 [uncultured bacterium]